MGSSNVKKTPKREKRVVKKQI